MTKTNIEWTDAVWNPVTGCTKVSAGCRNCYAETIANRFWKDRKFTDVVCHEDRLEQPLHWKKPRMIFVNSMSDLFHEDVPYSFMRKCFTTMYRANEHTYQILTKRPQRMLDFMKVESARFGIAGHIWLGVSVEDQKTADERIPMLLKIPAKVRWISIEPLLEDISKSFMRWTMEMEGWIKTNEIWVVIGGESGPKARPCNTFWIKNIVEICQIQNIPVFVKQLGSNPIGSMTVKKGKNSVYDYFPDYIKVREYPERK